MVTRQATLRHPWVLLLIGSFLLPLAGCEPTTPTMTTMKPEPPPAGNTWTVVSRDAGALDNPRSLVGLSGVAWNGTRFVAVGSKQSSTASGGFTFDTLIMHSTDGTTWTAAPVAVASGARVAHVLTGVAWGGGRFVAVGSKQSFTASGGFAIDTLIMHSTDGATWTVAPVAAAGLLYGVAWNGTHFVAVGSMTEIDLSVSGGYREISGVVMRSTDGATWTEPSMVDGTNTLRGVTWGDGRFVVVGGFPDGTIHHSADGAVWTAASGVDEGTGALNGVAWGGGRFVAVGGSPDGTIHHSADGAAWTAASGVDEGTGALNGVTWGGGRFVAVGSGTVNVGSGSAGNGGTGSEPGGTGSEPVPPPAPAPPPGAVLQAVETETTELKGAIVHSTDGATWAAAPVAAAWGTVDDYYFTQAAKADGSIPISARIGGVTYDGTRFVAVGAVGGKGLILTSP